LKNQLTQTILETDSKYCERLEDCGKEKYDIFRIIVRGIEKLSWDFGKYGFSRILNLKI